MSQDEAARIQQAAQRSRSPSPGGTSDSSTSSAGRRKALSPAQNEYSDSYDRQGRPKTRPLPPPAPRQQQQHRPALGMPIPSSGSQNHPHQQTHIPQLRGPSPNRPPVGSSHVNPSTGRAYPSQQHGGHQQQQHGSLQNPPRPPQVGGRADTNINPAFGNVNTQRLDGSQPSSIVSAAGRNFSHYTRSCTASRHSPYDSLRTTPLPTPPGAALGAQQPRPQRGNSYDLFAQAERNPASFSARAGEASIPNTYAHTQRAGALPHSSSGLRERSPQRALPTPPGAALGVQQPRPARGQPKDTSVQDQVQEILLRVVKANGNNVAIGNGVRVGNGKAPHASEGTKQTNQEMNEHHWQREALLKELKVVLALPEITPEEKAIKAAKLADVNARGRAVVEDWKPVALDWGAWIIKQDHLPHAYMRGP
ncbi:hypothetical protein AURDEDRAFT_124077 [Auricularia subglabra TFB-10046 SS5]|nr:hypothetical protein AURDEDRAFT_124077 [Auricularia subglabra TFB-10046 SS5]